MRSWTGAGNETVYGTVGETGNEAGIGEGGTGLSGKPQLDAPACARSRLSVAKRKRQRSASAVGLLHAGKPLRVFDDDDFRSRAVARQVHEAAEV